MGAGKKGCVPKDFFTDKGPYGSCLRRGDALFLHKENMTVCVWRDNRLVVMLSTLPHVISIVILLTQYYHM